MNIEAGHCAQTNVSQTHAHHARRQVDENLIAELCEKGIEIRSQPPILGVTGETMKRLIASVLIALGALPAAANDADTLARDTVFATQDATDLARFIWTKRPIVVFADTPADPRFAEQVALLEAEATELLERDVVVVVDTDPAAASPLRRKLRPRGFMMVLIGKDGGVKLRKPFAWDVRELSRAIDKMPMRLQEMRGASQARQPEG